MRTSDLTGALLDYWTARAEGVPAADLELRAAGTLCVRNIRGTPGKIAAVQVLDYSTNWALCGPLLETYGMDLENPVDPVRWRAEAWSGSHCFQADGPTAMIAICRAVVRAAFGDEVEDLPC